MKNEYVCFRDAASFFFLSFKRKGSLHFFFCHKSVVIKSSFFTVTHQTWKCKHWSSSISFFFFHSIYPRTIYEQSIFVVLTNSTIEVEFEKSITIQWTKWLWKCKCILVFDIFLSIYSQTKTFYIYVQEIYSLLLIYTFCNV